MDMGSDAIAGKLLDVLRREEKAIRSGRWEKLAPLDRLRSRLWKSLNGDSALTGIPRSTRGYRRLGPEQKSVPLVDGNGGSTEFFVLTISRKMAETLRDQSDVNTRLLTEALAEVGEKLMAARRRSQAATAYGEV